MSVMQAMWALPGRKWLSLEIPPATQTTALLKEFPGFFMLKSLAQVELRDGLRTSCGYLWFLLIFPTSCGFLLVGF